MTAMTATTALPLPKLPEPLPLEVETSAAVVDQVSDAIDRFHNDTHPGARRFCTERPCREVAGIIHGNLL